MSDKHEIQQKPAGSDASGEGGVIRIDYGPPARRLSIQTKRALLGMPVIAVIILAIMYGPRVFQHWMFLRTQAACLDASLPTDWPMIERDRTKARTLLQTRAGEYHEDPWGYAVRSDPRWDALRTAMRALEGGGARGLGDGDWGVVFLHERRNSAGEARLIRVDSTPLVGDLPFNVTVVQPATTFSHAKQLPSRMIISDADSLPAFLTALTYGEDVRIWAGVLDASDASRFTIPITFGPVTESLHFRLEDDDTISVKFADPAAFIARVKASRGRQ